MRSTARPPIARPSADDVAMLAASSTPARSFCPRRRSASTASSERMRLLGPQPGAEGEHAARQRRAQQDRNVAGDLGLVGARRPDHDHLRLGMQQRIGAVALFAQRVDLGRWQAASRCVARARVRSSAMAVATANRMTPSERVRAARSCRSSAENASRYSAAGRSLRASRGRQKRGQSPRRPARIACATQAWGLRHVSGSCPAFLPVPLIPGHGPGNLRWIASNIRHVARESKDFTLKGSRAVRVQIVNGQTRVAARNPEISIAMNRLGAAVDPAIPAVHRVELAALAQRLGAPRQYRRG